LIPQFALRLIVGLSLTWCLLPRRMITSGFFRIQMLVTLGLSVLTALTAWQGVEVPNATAVNVLRGGAIATAALSFLGSVLWALERRQGGTIAAVLVAVVGTATLLTSQSESIVTAAGRLVQTSALTSAGLLGTLVGAMLLGHWYLTATGMHLTPLIRATQLAFAAVLLRVVMAIFGTLAAPAEVRAALWGTEFVWTLLRWSAGLAGPLVLTGLTFRILRYRNTQSATGVLFAAVILAFIGEAAALLLLRELHWPL
jgi:hypothetical protein